MDPVEIQRSIRSLREELPRSVKLVAVSKYKPREDILAAYAVGQRSFGENRPQELCLKVRSLPSDIEWHFIGHLQTNKLKMVLPYADLVQSVDSLHLLGSICQWVDRGGLVRRPDGRVGILLELHLGEEETKHGMDEEEIESIVKTAARGGYPQVELCGLMGMATNTEDETLVRRDFRRIYTLFSTLREKYSLPSFTQLSIGMSGDWRIAVEEGATIVRIGSSIFGEREYV